MAKKQSAIIRYTRVRKTKDGVRVNIRIFTNSRFKFVVAWLRAQYEFSRGNSYERNDLW
jgi:hypothetical protein